MAQRGKLIAFEGIDGAGKRTQAEMLGRALEARGVGVLQYGFPKYESTFGKLVARFLNGEFGALESVDAHFSALLYAGDRFEAKPELEAALAAGKTIIADRYIASNLAHQTARVPREKRGEFTAWLRHLEYGIYGLPAEDLVLYLRLTATEGQQRVGQKKAREYTALGHDLQESNLGHLEQAALVYDELARGANWVTVEMFDRIAGKPKECAEIHREVMAAVETRVLARVMMR